MGYARMYLMRSIQMIIKEKNRVYEYDQDDQDDEGIFVSLPNNGNHLITLYYTQITII